MYQSALYCALRRPGKEIIGLGERFAGIQYHIHAKLYDENGAEAVASKLPLDWIVIEPNNDGQVFHLVNCVVKAIEQKVYTENTKPVISIASSKHNGLIEKLRNAYDLPFVKGYVYGSTIDAGLSRYRNGNP